MEQYARYLRKSRFDRDYAELSVEETLKRHEAILDKLANDRGYYIAKTFYEVVSGESIAARPEIQKLLEEVNDGLYAGVLVVDVERLARGNSGDQAYISQVFQFTGTKIITPTKIYDPSNEFDEEYFEFGLFMSRREYKTINRRLIRGRQSSASEGKYLGSIAPYGYQRIKLEGEKGYSLVQHPEEAQVVQRMYDMFLHNKGTMVIANTLNDQHVPTRHGGLWIASTIAHMLENPVYMGRIRRGWAQQYKTMENGIPTTHVRHLKNIEDYTLYDGLHPALVSEEDFYEVQRLRGLLRGATKQKKDFELQNSFAGLIFCARCGKRIGRSTMSRNNNSRIRMRCVNMRNCHNSSADFDVVEDAILDALRDWLKGYKVKIDGIGYADDIANGKEQLVRLEQEEEKIQAQMDKAYNLVEQGIYTLEIFKARHDKLTASKTEIEQRKAAILEELQKLEENEATQSSLIPNTEELLGSYDMMTVQERNTLLKAILRKIEYEKGEDGKIVLDLYPMLPQF